MPSNANLILGLGQGALADFPATDNTQWVQVSSAKAPFMVSNLPLISVKRNSIQDTPPAGDYYVAFYSDIAFPDNVLKLVVKTPQCLSVSGDAYNPAVPSTSNPATSSLAVAAAVILKAHVSAMTALLVLFVNTTAELIAVTMGQ